MDEDTLLNAGLFFVGVLAGGLIMAIVSYQLYCEPLGNLICKEEVGETSKFVGQDLDGSIRCSEIKETKQYDGVNIVIVKDPNE